MGFTAPEACIAEHMARQGEECCDAGDSGGRLLGCGPASRGLETLCSAQDDCPQLDWHLPCEEPSSPSWLPYDFSVDGEIEDVDVPCMADELEQQARQLDSWQDALFTDALLSGDEVAASCYSSFTHILARTSSGDRHPTSPNHQSSPLHQRQGAARLTHATSEKQLQAVEVNQINCTISKGACKSSSVQVHKGPSLQEPPRHSAAPLSLARPNAAQVGMYGLPTTPGAWRGCQKSAWCDRENRHRGICNHKATVPAYSEAGGAAGLLLMDAAGEEECRSSSSRKRPRGAVAHGLVLPWGKAARQQAAAAGRAPGAWLERLPSLDEDSDLGSDYEGINTTSKQPAAGHAFPPASNASGPGTATGLYLATDDDDDDLDGGDSDASGDAFALLNKRLPGALQQQRGSAFGGDNSNAPTCSDSDTHGFHPPHGHADADKEEEGIGGYLAVPATATDEDDATTAATAAAKAGGAPARLLPLLPPTAIKSTRSAAGSPAAPPAPAGKPAAAGGSSKGGNRPFTLQERFATFPVAREDWPWHRSRLQGAGLLSCHTPEARLSRKARFPGLTNDFDPTDPGEVGAKQCTACSKQATPVWRAGPHGPKTLCNACGVRWMKTAKRSR